MSSNSDDCAICLSNLKSWQGKAIHTAECSHSFHFDCIADSVKHGNRYCSVCSHRLNLVPLQSPGVVVNPPPAFPRIIPGQSGMVTSFEPLTFSDDEALPSTTPKTETPSSGPQSVAVKTYTEYSAISAAESCPRFPVLANIRAPALGGQARTHIDLVTVLDVSSSMSGLKINLLKRAVKFLIDNLGDSDRLSIVLFSNTAKRVLPLRRMSADGRECAMLAVDSLGVGSGTNIVEGLNKGVKVLEDRRARNPVSSTILLSDGQDRYIRDATVFVSRMPAAARSGNIPVHAFGFGHDHDASIMNGISNSSGGTFSFIESFGMVQDAFAMCIGGLLSVVAQELRLTVRSTSPGVQIVSIPSGRYTCTISDEYQQAVVDVGSMYAEEEKQFLVYLLVPAYSETGTVEGVRKTPLLYVSCEHKDLASNMLKQVQCDIVETQRPEAWSPADETVCLEVDRERNRILAAEGIAEAQVMAESGNFEGAQSTLAQRREKILASAAAQAGDGFSKWLEHELSETRVRMASRNSYAQVGRAFALAGLSAHKAQRATTRGDMTSKMLAVGASFRGGGGRGGLGCGGARRTSGRGGTSGGAKRAVGYETPAMLRMVERSKKSKD